jgi:hypothetical protein
MKNIKTTQLFFFLFILMTAFSCTPEKTEIWYEKDGAGKMEITMDLGEMASMVGGMMEGMDESGGDKPKKDMWGKGEKIDSTMNFYAMMPDSVKETMTNPELLKKFNMHMNIDSEKEYAKIKMELSYDSADEMKEILMALQEMQSKQKGGMMAAAGGDSDISAMFNGFEADLKNGIIRMDGADMSDMKDDPEFGEMIAMLEDPEKSEDPEMAAMMQMMFGGDVETIVHAPGKILFTNDMDAIINGNTVTFKDNIIELMKSEKAMGRVIKFKN